MKRLPLLLVVAVAIVTGGCQECPEIIIETANCDECKIGDFQAGRICMDSNVAGCPFTVISRFQTIIWSDTTFSCRLLEADGYTVTFREVEGYETPGSMDVELKAGERIMAQGNYAPN